MKRNKTKIWYSFALIRDKNGSYKSSILLGSDENREQLEKYVSGSWPKGYNSWLGEKHYPIIIGEETYLLLTFKELRNCFSQFHN